MSSRCFSQRRRKKPEGTITSDEYCRYGSRRSSTARNWRGRRAGVPYVEIINAIGQVGLKGGSGLAGGVVRQSKCWNCYGVRRASVAAARDAEGMIHGLTVRLGIPCPS